MKGKTKALSAALCLLLALALCMCVVFAGCQAASHDDSSGNISGESGGDGEEDVFVNSGEYTGNVELTETKLAGDAIEAVGTVSSAVYTTEEDVRANATEVTSKSKEITSAGDYYVQGDSLSGKKITISADGVTLYLVNAELSNEKKVIETDNGAQDLTITLIGENSITNSEADTNAVTIDGTLTINGPGSLSITSTKNIKANSFIIVDATVTLNAAGDGLHAEIDYDKATVAPEFSYSDGGFVYTKNASVTVAEAGDDGIQADTFVYIDEGSEIDVTATSKGIKAGKIDWGEDDTEIEDGDYLIYINGDVTVKSTDDAIHSNHTAIIEDGDLYLSSGDDAVHAEELLQVYGGYVEVTESYEGLEAAKVEVTGGYVNVTSSDDGINGADGTDTTPGVPHENCHIILNGGVIYVDAGGDGVDSNGDMLISGGVLFVSGSTAGDDAALDSESGILITGGYVFACGALGMVETPSTSSTQYVISYAQKEAISAGTTLYLKDSDGNVLLYYTVPKACQSVILSSPDLAKGSTYSVYGGSTLLATCTISSIITSAGSSTGSTPGSGSGGSIGGSGSFGGNMGNGSGGAGGGFTGSGSMGGFGKR